MHEERLVADHGPRAEHGMAEAERRRLADVDGAGRARQDAAQRIEQVVLALRLERGLEFRVGIEVILDRPLGTAGHEHEVRGTGLQGLLGGVLDQRLVDDGQHFLRRRLGRGQEARAAAGHGKYGSTDRSLGGHGVSP